MHLHPIASPYSTWYINYPATGLINPLLTRVHRTSGQFWGLHLQLLRIKKISILAELLLHSIHILAALFTGPVLIDDPSIYMLCIHTILLQLLLHFTFDILNVYCTILCPALVRIHVFMCYRLSIKRIIYYELLFCICVSHPLVFIGHSLLSSLFPSVPLSRLYVCSVSL